MPDIKSLSRSPLLKAHSLHRMSFIMTRVERPERVEEFMLRNLVTAPPGMTLSDAEVLVRSARLRHLVVVEEGILVGLVSHRELLDRSLRSLRETRGPNGADSLSSITIDDLVRTEVVTITPEASLEAAASRMLALRIGCLPVAISSPRGLRLVGLLNEAGLLGAAYVPAPLRSRG
jgi:CBS domain-containing protein